MFWTVTQTLLSGLLTTFEIFAFTLLFALPLGLVIAFGSMSKFKPLKWLIHTIVWIIRGTPLMLQLLIIFYGPGMIGMCGAATRREESRQRLLHLRLIMRAIFPLFSEAESKAFPQDRERPERCSE